MVEVGGEAGLELRELWGGEGGEVELLCGLCHFFLFSR